MRLDAPRAQCSLRPSWCVKTHPTSLLPRGSHASQRTLGNSRRRRGRRFHRRRLFPSLIVPSAEHAEFAPQCWLAVEVRAPARRRNDGAADGQRDRGGLGAQETGRSRRYRQWRAVGIGQRRLGVGRWNDWRLSFREVSFVAQSDPPWLAERRLRSSELVVGGTKGSAETGVSRGSVSSLILSPMFSLILRTGPGG